MRVEVCDKCGKEMKQFDWSSVRYPYIKIEKVHNITMKTTYDLCYGCQQKLEQWLNNEEIINNGKD